jgi:hypothetical protein
MWRQKIANLDFKWDAAQDASASVDANQATSGEPASSSSESDTGGSRRPDEAPSDRDAEPDAPKPQSNLPPRPDRSQKRGRRPIDLRRVEDEVGELMDEFGDFEIPGDPKWNCVGHLIEKLDRFGIGRTVLYEKVPAIVEQWRIRKSRGESGN